MARSCDPTSGGLGGAYTGGLSVCITAYPQQAAEVDRVWDGDHG